MHIISCNPYVLVDSILIWDVSCGAYNLRIDRHRRHSLISTVWPLWSSTFQIIQTVCLTTFEEVHKYSNSRIFLLHTISSCRRVYDVRVRSPWEEVMRPWVRWPILGSLQSNQFRHLWNHHPLLHLKHWTQYAGYLIPHHYTIPSYRNWTLSQLPCIN